MTFVPFFSIKFRKFWHTARFSTTNRHKVIKSEKQSGFFGPPCIFLIFIVFLTSLTKKEYIQPTNILLVYLDHFTTIWLKPTRHHLSYQRNLKYLTFLIVSLTKQVSTRFLDAPAQQFSVRPTSHTRFLNVNCNQLTDMHTRLQPTPQTQRSPATFDLQSQVAGDHSVCGVGRSFICMSVSLSQFSSRINSRALSAWQCTLLR